MRPVRQLRPHRLQRHELPERLLLSNVQDAHARSVRSGRIQLRCVQLEQGRQLLERRRLPLWNTPGLSGQLRGRGVRGGNLQHDHLPQRLLQRYQLHHAITQRVRPRRLRVLRRRSRAWRL